MTKITLLTIFIFTFAFVFGCSSDKKSSNANKREVKFEKTILDSRFRSEATAAGDVNRDGKIDVMAGEVWYAAPDWKMYEVQKPGKYRAKRGYSETFGQFAFDANGDGWVDVITSNMQNRPILWFENPKNMKDRWKKHIGFRNTANETIVAGKLLGNSKIVPVFGVQPEGYIGWFDIEVEPGKQWKMNIIGGPDAPASKKYSHGLGLGDMNGDSRMDVVCTEGWWEAPENPREPNWVFHKTELGPDCSDMLVYDVDGDGDSDVISSSAHKYGVWWHENSDGKGTKFKRHLIYDKVSQTHAMRLADINGDGVMDFVTGKRYYAHNGKDIGSDEPAIIFWMEIKRSESGPEFIYHEIDNDSGVGTQFDVVDLNNDSKLDIVVASKKGVFVFEQESTGLFTK
jgi:hypothetical protein